MKISPLVAAAALVGCLLPVSGLAQTSTRPDTSTPARGSTRTMTPDSNHRMVEGEVTKVDADKGWVDVKTPDGRMKLHFPPSTLDNVKAGDRVTLELGLSRGKSATR